MTEVFGEEEIVVIRLVELRIRSIKRWKLVLKL